MIILKSTTIFSLNGKRGVLPLLLKFNMYLIYFGSNIKNYFNCNWDNNVSSIDAYYNASIMNYFFWGTSDFDKYFLKCKNRKNVN